MWVTSGQDVVYQKCRQTHKVMWNATMLGASRHTLTDGNAMALSPPADKITVYTLSHNKQKMLQHPIQCPHFEHLQPLSRMFNIRLPIISLILGNDIARQLTSTKSWANRHTHTQTEIYPHRVRVFHGGNSTRLQRSCFFVCVLLGFCVVFVCVCGCYVFWVIRRHTTFSDSAYGARNLFPLLHEERHELLNHRRRQRRQRRTKEAREKKTKLFHSGIAGRNRIYTLCANSRPKKTVVYIQTYMGICVRP